MSVLLNAESKVVVVGATGRFGRQTLEDMRAAGTNVVAGVAYKASSDVDPTLPLFSSVSGAVAQTGANAAIVFVPASRAVDPLLETLESGVKLVVYPGEGLPILDAITVRRAALANGVVYVGANTPGLITPGVAKLGFMPTDCYTPGPVGVISRSGSLSYEAAAALTTAGIGQSTAIGIGGDPIRGLTAGEAIELFHSDDATQTVVYLGEIGGDAEYEIADYAARPDAKPVVAHIVGRTAPKGKQMGHAAALVGSHRDTWDAKVEALEAAGVVVARSMRELPEDVGRALRGHE
ncbi:succinate--CoA ligase subunit alpha [Microbacterium sp. A84]|uniref:succinate--CoA ligase subunit alpha n=1 Tax=Microbacterium sp. A84 TaxID=3450715 RepID=UPI003F43740D